MSRPSSPRSRCPFCTCALRAIVWSHRRPPRWFRNSTLAPRSWNWRLHISCCKRHLLRQRKRLGHLSVKYRASSTRHKYPIRVRRNFPRSQVFAAVGFSLVRPGLNAEIASSAGVHCHFPGALFERRGRPYIPSDFNSSSWLSAALGGALTARWACTWAISSSGLSTSAVSKSCSLMNSVRSMASSR